MVLQSYEEGQDKGLTENNFSLGHEHKRVSTRSNSFFSGDPSEQRPGWPLMRRNSSVVSEASNGRKMSVVQWVMSLPDRYPTETPPQCTDSPLGREISDFVYKSKQNRSSSWVELLKELELLKTNSSDCLWFSHEVLKAATSQFSSGLTPNCFLIKPILFFLFPSGAFPKMLP